MATGRIERKGKFIIGFTITPSLLASFVAICCRNNGLALSISTVVWIQWRRDCRAGSERT